LCITSIAIQKVYSLNLSIFALMCVQCNFRVFAGYLK
jgi:hypothetical protein